MSAVTTRSGELWLIRHGEIESAWRQRCYGHTDVALSTRGCSQSETLASTLASTLTARPTVVMSSDLQRARYLAERLAGRFGLEVELCPALRERDFGTWEGRTWDDIYAETGDAMNGMLTAPTTWCPPGGETTFELRDRVLDWYRQLPAGVTVAVTHGGPIAALRGALDERPVVDWPSLIPAWGEAVEIP